MRASRHNGRSGKHGVYDVKHNDRNFDVTNSEHIDVNRTMQNVYWNCYQGYCLNGVTTERKMTFSEVEKLYYFEHYGDHVDAQNERNEKGGHAERNRTVEDAYEKACEVITDTVVERTREEDIKEIQNYKKWLSSDERKITKEKKDFAVKCLETLETHLKGLAEKICKRILTSLQNPKLKEQKKEEIRENAKISIREKLSRYQKQVAMEKEKKVEKPLLKNKNREEVK